MNPGDFLITYRYINGMRIYRFSRNDQRNKNDDIYASSLNDLLKKITEAGIKLVNESRHQIILNIN